MKALTSGKRAALRLKLGRNVLFNSDIWGNIWSSAFAERSFNCVGDGAGHNCFAACQKVLGEIWRFNSGTQQAISQLTGWCAPARSHTSRFM